MIPTGTSLPARKKISLEGSIFDYFDEETFTLAYRRSPRHAHVKIDTLILKNIRKALAKETKLIAWMEVDKTLKGSFYVRDSYTRSRALLAFDARVVFTKEELLDSSTLDKYIQG